MAVKNPKVKGNCRNPLKKSLSGATSVRLDATTGDTCVYFLHLHGKRLKLREEFPRKLLKYLTVSSTATIINVGSSIIEESLLSMEELDRTSPELWPEQIPGVSEYLATTTSYGKGQNWMKGLDNDDKAFLFYLSKLTPSGLVAEVKKLYDTAYQLGCEESKEMTRGKYLKVLLKKSNSGSV